MRASTTPSDRSCTKCGGRAEHVVTLPKSKDHGGYKIYRCMECEFVEWLPQSQQKPEAPI
jgi:DNA-directed RNA polymerase subunit M/transcription elongation factor TFIIS